MELHWLLFLVITILMSNSAPCFCDTPNDIYSYKREYSNHKLKSTGIDTNNIKHYSPKRYIYKNDDGVGEVITDRRWKYMRLKQQEKQDAKKLKKLKATIKKVLPPLLRLLRDGRDDDRYNYTEEDSSGQGMSDKRKKFMRLKQQQVAKKVKKLKATIKKVLSPVLRLLRDDRHDYTAENSSY